MIEYLQDAIENDPSEEFPQKVRDSGSYIRRTGDPVFDEWQEKAMRGEAIDFDAAFDDPESARQFEAAKAASRARFQGKRGVGLDDSREG